MRLSYIASLVAAGLAVLAGMVQANPVVGGGIATPVLSFGGPNGKGFAGGFAVGRSVAIGPGGTVKTGGFGPFIGGLPFFFRR